MAKQLWFYTGSQDLYGPETLQQVDEQSKVVVQQLVASERAASWICAAHRTSPP